MAALRAVGVRSDSGQDADCSDLVRLSVEVNQSRAVKWTPWSRQFSIEFKLSVLLHLQLNSAALFLR